MQERIKSVSPCRGFQKALHFKVAANQIGLIAEVKKASPSKGVIREDFDPPIIAKSYESAGAACVSVLTDTPYFQGEDRFLEQVRETILLPVLRKDFMLDPYQIVESRALGADCILLIMAALEDAQALELEAAASELGMDVLVEVHNQEELERALQLTSKLIGINNRNLKTLEVDLHTTEQLVRKIPKGYTVVCESGIADYDDVLHIKSVGVSCFLIGESLMRKKNIEVATREILGTKR